MTTSLLGFAFLHGALNTVCLAFIAPLCRSVIACQRYETLYFTSRSNDSLAVVPLSGNWSGSRFCDDRDLVIDQGQVLAGWASSVALLVNVVFKPLLTSWADRRSRMVVLVHTVVCSFLACVCFVLAAGVAGIDPADVPEGLTETVIATPTALIFLASALRGMRVTQVIEYSYITSASEEHLRGNAVIGLLGVQGLSSVVGGFVSYIFLQKDLHDYTTSYLVLTGLVLLPLLPLLWLHRAENLHLRALEDGSALTGSAVVSSGPEQNSSTVNPLALLREFVVLVRRSFLLRGLCAAVFLAVFGGGGALALACSVEWGRGGAVLRAFTRPLLCLEPRRHRLATTLPPPCLTALRARAQGCSAF